MTCKWFDQCPLRRLEEEGKIGDSWRKEYCQTEKNWQNCQRYQMAERQESHPDNLMPDETIKKLD